MFAELAGLSHLAAARRSTPASRPRPARRGPPSRLSACASACGPERPRLRADADAARLDRGGRAAAGVAAPHAPVFRQPARSAAARRARDGQEDAFERAARRQDEAERRRR